jgi:hypothetical protein
VAYRRRNPWSEWVPPSDLPPPELTPVFGVKTFDATTTCADIHPHGAIPSGSKCICMACHKSGVEHRVISHIKPGNGQIREGWQTAEQPTKYTPPPKGLRGGTGR